MELVFLLLCAIAGTDALEWTTDLEDGDLVYSCNGHDISLPWNVTLGPGETITDIQWLYTGLSEEVVAMAGHDLFLSAPTFSSRVQFVPEAGLILTRATVSDEGNYTVEITTRSADDLSSYRHTALVHVATEAKARTDSTMTVSQDQTAVYSNTTGQYHVKLTCSSQGRQPPAVIWKTPSGSEVPSSAFVNDQFILLLPNPVSGGSYTCRIAPDAPAASCLPKDDPVLEGASVSVDEVKARLTLIEAEQGALASENAHLKEENSLLKSELDDFINGTKRPRVSFHAKLSSTLSLSSGQVIVLQSVTTNQGNAYNQSTGYFTAPYNGTYVFLATAGPYASSSYRADLDLVVDGSVISSLRTMYGGTFTVHDSRYGNQNYVYGAPKTGSCNAVVHLTAGQRVWLKSASSSYFDAQVTSFSGYLLSYNKHVL